VNFIHGREWNEADMRQQVLPEQDTVQAPGPSRRALLAGAGFLLAAGAAGTVRADEHAEHGEHGEHAHHEGGGHADIIAAAMACQDKGQACISHCISLFRAGDTSVADCAWRVEQMLPICDTMARYVALESPHLVETARLCIAVCTDCEKECRKHADHHTACRNCAEACAECVKRLKTLVS
jgi:Cys-rich four helix bundle protein (predicted Tat secretion target)